MALQEIGPQKRWLSAVGGDWGEEREREGHVKMSTEMLGWERWEIDVVRTWCFNNRKRACCLNARCTPVVLVGLVTTWNMVLCLAAIASYLLD